MFIGLKKSSNTFLKAMEVVMAVLSRNEIEIYLDDIIVFSETLEEYILRLESLKKTGRSKLDHRIKKCQFLKHEARILKHISGNGEIRMNPEKIKAVMDYPSQQ
jgi:predicted HicB family RNase H-like nuclease